VSVNHYENFPVASWLCPAPLRPPITAIYWFARTADDIADEGPASPAERRAELAAYRKELAWVAAGGAPHPRFQRVFTPLARQIKAFNLPVNLLDDLLDAFVQDAGNPVYEDRTTLLDYCRRSANPIGRLLLHLYGITDRTALAQSDAICSALQLINFWQDLSVDLPRGRRYVPRRDARRHGLDAETLAAGPPGAAERALLRELVDWSRELMLRGAPLVHTLTDRSGWELRLVVQGGLRILEKIEQMDYASFAQRPSVGSLDAPLLLWRCLGMRRSLKARPA